MNAEIRDRWLAALRSGDYLQGTGSLRTVSDEFCCLGVLVDVVCPNEWEPVPVSGTTSFCFRGHQGTLPSVFKHDIGGINGYDDDLMNMNDIEGMTFEQIADWIEENIPTEEGASQ